MALLPVEQNPPCRVNFAGFETDTFTLGKHGWDIALNQAVNPSLQMRSEFYMTLRHPPSGLVGMAHAQRGTFDLMDWKQYRRYDALPLFHVTQLANRITVRFNTVDPFVGYRWVETEPQLEMVEERDIFTLPLFREKAAPAGEKLIVEPATVSELLEQIRRRQAPQQAEIRDRERRREARPIVHASILTLQAA